MSFTLSAKDPASSARCGTLEFPNRASKTRIETPGLICHTELGTIPLLFRELREELAIQCLGLPFQDLWSFLEGEKGFEKKSLREILNVKNELLMMTFRDAILFPEQTTVKHDERSFESSNGRKAVKVSQYVKAAQQLKPDCYTSIYDEAPSTAGLKRQRKSVDTSLRWLDECLKVRPKGSLLFGPILGGTNAELRQLSARETAARGVDGFAIAGLGLGELREQRLEAVRSTIACLPETAPRLIFGVTAYDEILEAISEGIDLFSSAYPFVISQFGFASTINWEKLQWEGEGYPHCPGDQLKINLRDKRFAKDMDPISRSCQCFACRNHSRAYINHLLNAHEMLATVLLCHHNLHNFLVFFQVTRDHLKRGVFENFKSQVGTLLRGR